MPATKQRPRRVSDAQLEQLLALTAAETRDFLSSQGVDLLGEQQIKTKTALEYFSRNLGAAATA